MTSAKSFDVCVFGSLNIDYFTYLDRQPQYVQICDSL